MRWDSIRVLVAGGCGLIGSNLVTRLVEGGAHVQVVDNLWRGKKNNLIKDGRSLIDFERDFFELDLRDYENCARVVREQDIIFHLADVVAGINFVFDHQFFVFNSNMTIDSNMLRAAVDCKVPSYLYVGSACSYPAEKQQVLNAPPLKEEDAYPASPESSYGWCKLMGEYACELVQREGHMSVGVLRLHNVYGPQCETAPETSQVIPALIRRAIKFPQEDFVVWGSGNQRRAFTYVDDVVTSIVRAAEVGMNQGVIQIGPDTSTSIRSIAEMIVSISGKEIDIQFDRTKREGDMDRSADLTRAEKILGWSPTTGIEEGLRKTYAWCERHMQSR